MSRFKVVTTCPISEKKIDIRVASACSFFALRNEGEDGSISLVYHDIDALKKAVDQKSVSCSASVAESIELAHQLLKVMRLEYQNEKLADKFVERSERDAFMIEVFRRWWFGRRNEMSGVRAKAFLDLINFSIAHKSPFFRFRLPPNSEEYAHYFEPDEAGLKAICGEHSLANRVADVLENHPSGTYMIRNVFATKGTEDNRLLLKAGYGGELPFALSVRVHGPFDGSDNPFGGRNGGENRMDEIVKHIYCVYRPGSGYFFNLTTKGDNDLLSKITSEEITSDAERYTFFIDLLKAFDGYCERNFQIKETVLNRFDF